MIFREFTGGQSSATAANVGQGREGAGVVAEWDGALPAGSEFAAECEGLFRVGFLPLECKAGDLLCFAGTLDHLSLPNLHMCPRFSSPHLEHL